MADEQQLEDATSADPVTIHDSWMWIKDSKGYGSVTTTFTTIAFYVTTFAYIASIFEKIGPITIRPFDVGACSAYFIPVLTLYFGRKFTESKFAATSAAAVPVINAAAAAVKK